jgi:hypothetical protein
MDHERDAGAMTHALTTSQNRQEASLITCPMMTSGKARFHFITVARSA